MSHTAGRPSRLIDTMDLLNHVCLRMCVLEREREKVRVCLIIYELHFDDSLFWNVPVCNLMNLK